MIAVTATESRLDRWFYTSMAVIFASAAIIGFTPNSLAILAGTKENPPLLIHIHAAAMSLWLVLLSTQAVLVASGKRRYHAQLGMVSFVLAPFIVVLMILIAFPLFQGGEHTYSIGVVQIKRVILFSSFFLLAVLARKRDSEAHKRLMFLATLVVLDAAFNRMGWLLPDFGITNVMALTHAYELVLLVPLLAYDWLKTGRIHRVYAIGVPIIVAFSVVASALW